MEIYWRSYFSYNSNIPFIGSKYKNLFHLTSFTLFQNYAEQLLAQKQVIRIEVLLNLTLSKTYFNVFVLKEV